MKIWKEENKLGGGGYIIYVQIGKWIKSSWWSGPPKHEKHFHIGYIIERYPIITTKKRLQTFQKLWNEMWDKEDKPKARKIIEDFIKENRYTYSVEDILEDYPKFKKFYTSYTMTHCIKNLEPQIKTLLDLWEV